MTSRRYLFLGLFFMLAMSILGYYTLFLTDFRLFGSETTLRVYFSQANGLRAGDPVLVAGMRWGRVKEMRYDPKADDRHRIDILLRLDEPLELREEFRIQVEDATLLGGRVVFIDPGPAGGALINPENTTLYGRVQDNALERLGNFLGEDGQLGRVFDNIDLILQDLRSGRGILGKALTDETMAGDLTNSLKSAAEALANLEGLTRELTSEDSTLGALFTNREMYDLMQTIADRLADVLLDTKEVTQAMRSGESLAGRVFYDEKMGEDTAAAIEALRKMAERIENGEGTLGQLIADDSIARDLKSVLAGLESGEGTLGLLLKEATLYEDMERAVDDLSVVARTIREGEGSMGKFIMDDELYLEARRALGIVTRSLEEFREAAPVTTFTSVLFGAF